jgi:hypothetical protein
LALTECISVREARAPKGRNARWSLIQQFSSQGPTGFGVKSPEVSLLRERWKRRSANMAQEMVPRWSSKDGRYTGPWSSPHAHVHAWQAQVTPGRCQIAAALQDDFGADCAGVWQGHGGEQETRRQAGGQATRRVGRIEGAERQALLCKGFACLSLAASKSSSIELASRHRAITPSAPRDADGVERKRCAAVREGS